MKLLALPGFCLLVASLLTSQPGHSHGGGLNAAGCHNNRKTGDYHCHRASYSRPVPAPSTQPTPSGAYRNCTLARQAGAAPVYRGDAGYGPHLDRDNDGIGCE